MKNKNYKDEALREKRTKTLYWITSIFTFSIGAAALFASLMITKSMAKNSERLVAVPEISVSTVMPNDYIKETYKSESPNIEETKKSMESATGDEENGKIQEAYAENIPTSAYVSEEFTICMPCDGEILKKFSMDAPIKSKTMGDFRTHNGIDIKASTGTEVLAAADGVIEKIYTDHLLGVTVEIGHTENIKTQYSNLAGAEMVKVGDEIKKGQCIGCVGDTANGEKLDDAHLHFSVLSDNEYVEPKSYIR